MLWMSYQSSSFYYLSHNSCPISINDKKKSKTKQKKHRQDQEGTATPEIGLGPVGLRVKSSSVNLNARLFPAFSFRC